MNNIITELWNGSLCPIHQSGKNNQEIKHLEDLIQRNLENMENSFTPEQRNRLKKYLDCINEYLLVISEQTFYDGFCLGVKIAGEAFIGAEKII